MADPAILKNMRASQVEAFAQIVVLVAYADGTLQPEEEAVLRSRLTQWCGSTIDPERMENYLSQLPPLSRSSNNWRADRIQQLKLQLDDARLHEPAFALAVEVASADSRIGVRESKMLANMAVELDITPEFAKSVLASLRKGA